MGKVRKTNQDYCLTKQLPDGAFAVVCDGMGGARGGDVASKIAAEFIGEHVIGAYRESLKPSSLKALLESAVVGANLAVYNAAQQDPNLFGMGTTAVTALVSGDLLGVVNVGDSRAYLIRGNEISQLTRDHSYVQTMVEQGKITSKQAKSDPRKNIITRALGIEKKVEIDYCEYNLEQGDRILICTDGLTNHLEDSEILNLVLTCPQQTLSEQLIATANQKGGSDNITVVEIFYE